METQTEKFPRHCDCCKKGIWEGYLVNNDYTYCSIECISIDVCDDEEEIEEMIEQDEIFWTEWTEEDIDEDNA